MEKRHQSGMTPEQEQSFAEWLEARPPEIQLACALFPFGSLVLHEDKTFYIFGWAQTKDSDRTHDPLDTLLIFAPIEYRNDPEGAKTHKQYACARHFVAQRRH